MNITARIGRRHPLPPNVSSDVNSDGDKPLKLLCEPYTAAQGPILLDKVEPLAVPFFSSGGTVSIPTISRGVTNTPRSPRRISLAPPLPAKPAPVVPNINSNSDRNGRQAVSLRSVRSHSMMYTRKVSESPRYQISRLPGDAIYGRDTKRVSDHGDDQHKASQRSGRPGFPRLDLKGLDVSVEDEVAQDIPRTSAEEEDDPASITTRVLDQGQRYYTVQNDTEYSDYPSVLMSPAEHARHAVGFHYESFQSPCTSSNLISSPVSQKFRPPSTGSSSPSDLITSLTSLHLTDHPNTELSVANSPHSKTLRHSHDSFPFAIPGISKTHSASKRTVHAEEFLATTLSARLKELTLRIALTRCELSEYTNPTLALTTSLYVALPLAQQLCYTPLEGRCWYWVGRAEAARGNLQKAQEALERSLEAGLEGFGTKERLREGRDVRAVLEIVRARIASEIDRGGGSPGVSPALLSPLEGVGVRLRDIKQIQK